MRFIILFCIIFISCNKDWAYNEKQIFMNTCPDLRDSCKCQYETAYRNFTYKEFESILNQEASQKIRDRVNNLKGDFAKCKK